MWRGLGFDLPGTEIPMSYRFLGERGFLVTPGVQCIRCGMPYFVR